MREFFYFARFQKYGWESPKNWSFLQKSSKSVRKKCNFSKNMIDIKNRRITFLKNITNMTYTNFGGILMCGFLKLGLFSYSRLKITRAIQLQCDP